MARCAGLFDRLRRGEEGATMLEYAIMIGFIAITCAAAVTALGRSLSGPFQNAINGLS